MTINITTYEEGDYDLLISIWEKSGLPYKGKGRDSRENIEKEVKLDYNQFLFAIEKGHAVGSILVTHDGRKGWINRVAVLPEFRKKGIAKLLINAGEKWLMEQGIGIFACQIEEYNKDSFEAFQKMGYVPFEGIHYLTKRVHPDI
jgi:ribosomal protein S18 acetylase RimI-like enzyme